MLPLLATLLAAPPALAQTAAEAQLGLPGPVGACATVDTARLEALGGVATFREDRPAKDLHARLLAVGAVCRPGGGGTPAVELVAAVTIPHPTDPGASDSAWSREHPLVLAPLVGEVRFGRWPMDGVTAEPDAAFVRRLLKLDRQLYAGRRIGVLRVDPDLPASAVDEWVGEFARAGFVEVVLVVDPESWRPDGVSLSDEAPPPGPVRTPEDVVTSSEGDFTARFPSSTGIQPVDIPAGDVLRVEEHCADGACELVLVTADERILVRRATEAPADDLTRRWVFGRPVRQVTGSSLRHLRAPTLSGTVTALPKFSWTKEVTGKRGLLEHIYQRGNFLIRPCWYKQVLLRRMFLARDPFGSLTARLRVAVDGTVESVEILESNVPNKRVIACTVSGMMAMRLPRRPDGAGYSLDVPYGFKR